jgi:hypothetical protein
MGEMTVLEREELETIARDSAARGDPNHAIVASLRRYCLDKDIGPSDSELFVIAEGAIADQALLAKNQALRPPTTLTPRSKADRRKQERRQGKRRISPRRRSGLAARLADLKRLGQAEHRSDERRAGIDRRKVLRRVHVRRKDNR